MDLKAYCEFLKKLGIPDPRGFVASQLEVTKELLIPTFADAGVFLLSSVFILRSQRIDFFSVKTFVQTLIGPFFEKVKT